MEQGQFRPGEIRLCHDVRVRVRGGGLQHIRVVPSARTEDAAARRRLRLDRLVEKAVCRSELPAFDVFPRLLAFRDQSRDAVLHGAHAKAARPRTFFGDRVYDLEPNRQYLGAAPVGRDRRPLHQQIRACRLRSALYRVHFSLVVYDVSRSPCSDDPLVGRAARRDGGGDRRGEHRIHEHFLQTRTERRGDVLPRDQQFGFPPPPPASPL